MWSVLRKQILVPDQPRLDWGATGVTTSLDLGALYGSYLLERVPESTVINQGYTLPQITSAWQLADGILESTRGDAGAVCVAWRSLGRAGTAGYSPQFFEVKLGTRYSVRLTAQSRTASEPNGIPRWQGHHGLSASYGLFEILEDGVGCRATISHSSRMSQGNDHAIVAGFVKVEGQLHVIAWLTTLNANPNDYPFQFFFHSFGAGTAFLSCPVDEQYVCDGPARFSWTTQDHAIRLHLAAEKTGPWDGYLEAYPAANDALVASAGNKMASLRSRHANYLSPVFQHTFSQADYSRIPSSDLAGFVELFAQDHNISTYGGLAWLGACMGCADNGIASWLPEGAISNIHHDSQVNQRLSQVQVRPISLSGPLALGGTVTSGTATCSPAIASGGETPTLGVLVASINEYAGSAATNLGSTMSVLLSIYRRDKIVAQALPEAELTTEYAVRISLRFYQNLQSQAVQGAYVALSSAQASQLLAGQAIEIPITGSITGTVELQAIG